MSLQVRKGLVPLIKEIKAKGSAPRQITHSQSDTVRVTQAQSNALPDDTVIWLVTRDTVFASCRSGKVLCLS